MTCHFMKNIFILFVVFSLIGCSSFFGTYFASEYGNDIEIVFNADKTAIVKLSGESFEADYFEKNGIIEVWQRRKTPAIFLKRIQKDKLQLLNSKKSPTDIILIKQ